MHPTRKAAAPGAPDTPAAAAPLTVSGAPRRRLLERALVLAGGSLGLGLLGRTRAAEAAGAVPRREAAGGAPRTLTLYGRSWRQYGAEHRVGKAPRVGERLTTFGELLGTRDGPAVGEFHAAYLGTGSPFLAGPYAAGSIEFHTFTLPEGSIIGMGAATTPTATFAIIGGTGRYAGVSGSYLARQSPADQGGDGSAHFAFTFLNPTGAGAV